MVAGCDETADCEVAVGAAGTRLDVKGGWADEGPDIAIWKRGQGWPEFCNAKEKAPSATSCGAEVAGERSNVETSAAIGETRAGEPRTEGSCRAGVGRAAAVGKQKGGGCWSNGERGNTAFPADGGAVDAEERSFASPAETPNKEEEPLGYKGEAKPEAGAEECLGLAFAPGRADELDDERSRSGSRAPAREAELEFAEEEDSAAVAGAVTVTTRAFGIQETKEKQRPNNARELRERREEIQEEQRTKTIDRIDLHLFAV
jgi:hypothetical protein